MPKINIDKLSVEDLDALAKRAKAVAKKKRKKAEQEKLLKIGSIVLRNIDSFLKCTELEFKLKREIADIAGKQFA